MSDPEPVGEGTVSGNQVSIPAHVRRRLDIEDGDVLRWYLDGDGLRVEVVCREERAFEDFEPGASAEPVDGVEEHDAPGIGDVAP